MTWSIRIEGSTVGDAYAELLLNSAPKPIKTYVVQGIAGLAKIHGDDVLVDVQAHGHLCENESDGEVSTAEIGVRKSGASEKQRDPTIKEYMAAGYRAENYRYTVSTPEEIAAAVQAEKDSDAADAAKKKPIVHLEDDAAYRERITEAAKAAGPKEGALDKIAVATGTGLDEVGTEYGVDRIRP